MTGTLRRYRLAAGGLYRKWSVDRVVSGLPSAALVPVERAKDVVLLYDERLHGFDAEVHLRELAFAHELAARGRDFGVTADASGLFDKTVAWFAPHRLVLPRLWDYSRQTHEFAVGLERQGNRLYCSSDETLFWENKAYMHRRFAEAGVPTPRTVLFTGADGDVAGLDGGPVVVKEEHSSGSAGVRWFETPSSARAHLERYPFRPGETLVLQQVVPGATRDLRLTLVGDRLIESASYWRSKDPAAASGTWTTTATSFGTVVDHGGIPDGAVWLARDTLRSLGLRTAGLDVIWPDDDVTQEPLILELSPYYQPNPPKPARYADWTYKEYKSRPYVEDGYLFRQYGVYREIAGAALDQGLF